MAVKSVTNTEPCPVCAREEARISVQGYLDPIMENQYHRFLCGICGIEFWSPLVMPDASYYEEATGDYEAFHHAGGSKLKWWHKSFLDIAPLSEKPGKVLDIGCADGRFLSAMRQRGWEVWGIDLDSRSIAAAKINCPEGKFSVEMVGKFAERHQPQSFDLITFFEVLEHQPNALQFMQEVKGLLKPGGAIGGSVPNTDRYVVRNRFSPDDPPHHFTLWRKHVLRKFLEKEGFSRSQIGLTRFEPILLDQLVQRFAQDRIRAVKKNLGAKAGSKSSGNGSKFNGLSVLAGIKRFVWRPLVRIVGIAEYPILRATGKSISMFFYAKSV